MRPRAGTSAGFRVMPHRPSLAVLVALPLAGAIAGGALAWAVRHDGAERGRAAPVAAGARADVVTSGDVRLVLPQGWVKARGPVRLPGFERRDIALARGWNVDVALARMPAQTPSLLPPGLTERLGPMPRPTRVTAGARQAQRYSGLRLPRGTWLDVYVAPTTLGTVTWACWGPASARMECDVVLPRLRLSRGRFLPVGPEAAFLQGLPRVVRQLNLVRIRQHTALQRAATARAGGRAADRLAAGYEAAADELRRLVTGDSSASTTVALMDRLGGRHRRLAGTLRDRARAPFRRLARAIRADEALLARALARWHGLLSGSGERP
jgi:hypothetical protein